jgi:hypothetical protein
MINAVVTAPDGRSVLLIGLSFRNLDNLRASPMDDHIKIDGAKLGLSHDIIIVAGETEDAIMRVLTLGLPAMGRG